MLLKVPIFTSSIRFCKNRGFGFVEPWVIKQILIIQYRALGTVNISISCQQSHGKLKRFGKLMSNSYLICTLSYNLCMPFWCLVWDGVQVDPHALCFFLKIIFFRMNDVARHFVKYLFFSWDRVECALSCCVFLADMIVVLKVYRHLLVNMQHYTKCRQPLTYVILIRCSEKLLEHFENTSDLNGVSKISCWISILTG